MPKKEYNGLLVIGDPHLEGRQPGFRKDDYPNVILEKLTWCLDYARTQRLLPVILGDLFDKPRDNPNWLIAQLLKVMPEDVIGLYGNHDVHYNPELTDDDSLSLLIEAKRLRLVSEESPWRGVMNGREVIVGGSSYRQPIPKTFAPGGESSSPLVIWLTHHDILIPGYDEGRIRPREIPGVDLLINGHIHRKLDDIAKGQTRWLTPGNISRRSRSDASRQHVPSALRIDVSASDHQLEHIEVPHRPFEEVFHEAVVDGNEQLQASAFVTGLAELQARRTSAGAGLMEFLNHNLNQFEDDVAEEIITLAQEVTSE